MDTVATEVKEVRIEPERLSGLLGVPPKATGIVVFAHGSGSGRFSRRNSYVAEKLRQAGIATLLLDLLRPEEEADRRNVFDIPFLATRLVRATDWAAVHSDTRHLRPCYFGASTGAAAALMAAASDGARISAIVSRGGRPDLALPVLPNVGAATLLLVGSLDGVVVDMNRHAFDALACEKRLVIVEGAGHLFEEPGTLDEVVRHATDWFRTHLAVPGAEGG